MWLTGGGFPYNGIILRSPVNEAKGLWEGKNMADKTKKLFQITEAARACGLSRSTLLRMEKRGW